VSSSPKNALSIAESLKKLPRHFGFDAEQKKPDGSPFAFPKNPDPTNINPRKEGRSEANNIAGLGITEPAVRKVGKGKDEGSD
jgi:hypothetical protein